VDKQARTAIKHKKPAAGISITDIQVHDMFDWDVPADAHQHVTKLDERGRGQVYGQG